MWRNLYFARSAEREQLGSIPGFPSMNSKAFKRVLGRLGYETEEGATSGSHEWLVAEGRPRLRWAFHDSKRELSSVEVRNVLVKQVGLTLEEARRIASGK
jgi:hypothetical protein